MIINNLFNNYLEMSIEEGRESQGQGYITSLISSFKRRETIDSLK